MGKRGPQSKPTALKLLEGNPGKREVNGNEPEYDVLSKDEKPPAYLGSYGKKEWKRILPLLNKNKLATKADFIALAAYCQSVDTWVNAEKLKRADGLTATTSNGTLVQHPAVGIANSAMDKILKFGREFGLTPASRTGLSAEKYESEDNPLLSLIKRNTGG